MLYPVPAVLIGCRDKEGRDNLMTAAWAGTICSDPVMVSVSIRGERYSHHIIRESGEFVINLVGKKQLRAMDFCGVKSGRDMDKFAACGLTPAPAPGLTLAPLIAESPVNLSCWVEQVLELGSHDMFIGRILQVSDPATAAALRELGLSGMAFSGVC